MFPYLLRARKCLVDAEPIRASTLIFIILMGLSFLANRIVNFNESIVVKSLSVSGFQETQKGVFLAIENQKNFHILDALIPLVSNAFYEIRYSVRRSSLESVILVTDFYASGYDNPEQEISNQIGMSNLGTQQIFVFNSGKAPEQAHFRLFYTGAPGLEVADVQILRVPSWNVWLKRGLLASALGTLLILLALILRRVLNFSGHAHAKQDNAVRILPSEIPPVLAIYLMAALARFLMYILMPYWSGDEYVYKTIAAGIWHFGSHGVLTDSMVSNSVNLPNLLYPYLISPAMALGENFYEGIRLINAVVINLAIFPCYLIARKYLSQAPALVTASLSIAIPFANIGAFAVSEVLFFPLFLLSVWVAIESLAQPRSIGWAIGFGLAAGVLLNVRLTAMVLLPAYLFSLLWISCRHQQALTFLRRPYWLGSIIAFLFSYVSLKYLLGGKELGDFGFYGSVAEQSANPFSIIAKDPAGFFNLIMGHLTTLAIPYALPIALIGSTMKFRGKSVQSDDRFSDFLIIALIFSTALFLLGLTFTISVSLHDLGGLGRWHSRYYFYCYPLIIIAGIVFADRMQFKKLDIDSFLVFGIVLILLSCSIYFLNIYGALQNPWFGSLADNMDVQWYRHTIAFYWVFVAFTVVLTWLWFKRSSYFYGSFICFMVTWMIVANFGTLRAAGVSAGVQTDSCGKLSQHFLDQHPGRFVVVGDSRPAMVGAAFWNPYIPERAFIFSSNVKTLGTADIAVAADYLIVNGTIAVDTAYKPIVSIGKCAIYDVPN